MEETSYGWAINDYLVSHHSENLGTDDGESFSEEFFCYVSHHLIFQWAVGSYLHDL